MIIPCSLHVFEHIQVLHRKALTLDLKRLWCKNEKPVDTPILLPAPTSLHPRNGEALGKSIFGLILA